MEKAAGSFITASPDEGILLLPCSFLPRSPSTAEWEFILEMKLSGSVPTQGSRRVGHLKITLGSCHFSCRKVFLIKCRGKGDVFPVL